MKTIQRDDAHHMGKLTDAITQEFDYRPGCGVLDYSLNRMLIKGFKVGDIAADDSYEHPTMDGQGETVVGGEFGAGLSVDSIAIMRADAGHAKTISLSGWMHLKADDIQKANAYKRGGKNHHCEIEFGKCNEVQVGKQVKKDNKDMGLFLDLEGIKAKANQSKGGQLFIDASGTRGDTPETNNEWVWAYVEIFNFELEGSEIKGCGSEEVGANVSLKISNHK